VQDTLALPLLQFSNTAFFEVSFHLFKRSCVAMPFSIWHTFRVMREGTVSEVDIATSKLAPWFLVQSQVMKPWRKTHKHPR
jgi:hypothetical protein